jgi:hypothetical protein
MGKDEKSKNNSYWQLVVFSVLVSDYLDVGFIFNSLFDVRRSQCSVLWLQFLAYLSHGTCPLAKRHHSSESQFVPLVWLLLT